MQAQPCTGLAASSGKQEEHAMAYAGKCIKPLFFTSMQLAERNSPSRKTKSHAMRYA